VNEASVSQIKVLVVATRRDIKAEGIAAAVASCVDMVLAASRVLTPAEVGALLQTMSSPSSCALILVGMQGDAEGDVQRWLSRCRRLVVVRVDIVDDVVHFAARDLGIDTLLVTLRQLVARGGDTPAGRLTRIRCAR
jgi:hypothetical protein